VLYRNADDEIPKKSVATCQRGQVVEWFADKGYGFIKPDLSGFDNIFVHISQVAQKTKVTRGCVVSYSAKFDPIKKSDTASFVEVLPEKNTKPQDRNPYDDRDKRVYDDRDHTYGHGRPNRPTYHTGCLI